jgi:hypothetical protein
MAQVTGGSNFDGHWEESANVALALLREAADLFAKASHDTLTPDGVVTTLLWWLANCHQFPSRRRPSRFFDGVFQPPSPHESCAVLAQGRTRPRVAEIIDRLNRVMSTAANEWARGNPEEPDAREVLSALFDVLWLQRLIPRPPSNAYPRGV